MLCALENALQCANNRLLLAVRPNPKSELTWSKSGPSKNNMGEYSVRTEFQRMLLASSWTTTTCGLAPRRKMRRSP